MKGLVYHGDEVLKWEGIQDISPGDSEAKLKVQAAGVSGSDVHGYQRITGRRITPMVMGHEFSGIVWGVGSRITSLMRGGKV